MVERTGKKRCTYIYIYMSRYIIMMLCLRVKCNWPRGTKSWLWRIWFKVKHENHFKSKWETQSLGVLSFTCREEEENTVKCLSICQHFSLYDWPKFDHRAYPLLSIRFLNTHIKFWLHSLFQYKISIFQIFNYKVFISTRFEY